MRLHRSKINDFLAKLIRAGKMIDASVLRKNSKGSIRVITLMQIIKIYREHFCDEIKESKKAQKAKAKFRKAIAARRKALAAANKISKIFYDNQNKRRSHVK